MPKQKAVFAWFIGVLLFRSIIMMENGINYHESALQNVTLYGTKGSTSGIPLFMLEMDKPTFQAICVMESTVLQFVSLSLATCRALGYDALQRIYPSDAHLLDSLYHSTGLLLDINCSILKPELQHCKWRHAKKISCLLYLAVHCAECNHVVEIIDGTKHEIEFPALMPCNQHTGCDWKILNNQTMKKTVLDFRKQNTTPSLHIADQMLEIEWFDTANGTWFNLKGTFTRISNMGPIKIQSNTIIIHYYFVDCQFFDLTSIMQGNTASLKYYNEEYVFYKQEAISYFVPVALCTFLLTFIMTLAACTCWIRKRKHKMHNKHAFSVTYTPGLNVTYEEDKTKPADMWSAIYHQLSLDDRSACLPYTISYDCTKHRTGENEMNYVEFPNIAHPAPYTLRPFAGVYNPFPYGCSILCNHPADYEAKEIVKRVKDSWATEGKALLLPEEVTAIRSGFLPAKYDNGEDDVPEELFRRYTDTDSRPLTPAPTLESVMTKGSLRRCVTPDPIPTHILNPTRERTLLVLDLRRSHSQDTLSWCGLSFPTTTTMQPLTKNTSLVQTGQNFHLPIKKKNNVKKKGALSAKTAENDRCTNNKLQQQINTLSVSTDTLDVLADMTGGSGEEEPPKRRGKHRHHRKKSGKDGFRGPEKEFQGLPEPGETQVSALCSDSQNTSVQPSLTSGEMDVDLEVPIAELCRSSQGGSSFIDAATLKQLQRELDQEVIDSEFNPKR
ncbi:uncharacterized protein LOC110841103 isoform X2 [Zootermopsis nevadensis]|nr:uncharacterized protein LOC110841103 isoform X2 [Zootermopsis nevadensis]